METKEVARDRPGVAALPVFEEETRRVQDPSRIPIVPLEEEGIKRGTIDVKAAYRPGDKAGVLTQRSEQGVAGRPLRQGDGGGVRLRWPREGRGRRRGDWFRRLGDGRGSRGGGQVWVFGPAKELLGFREEVKKVNPVVVPIGDEYLLPLGNWLKRSQDRPRLGKGNDFGITAVFVKMVVRVAAIAAIRVRCVHNKTRVRVFPDVRRGRCPGLDAGQELA